VNKYLLPETVKLHSHNYRVHKIDTSSSAMAERPRELGDFKGVGHFEATFEVEGLSAVHCLVS